MAVTNGPRRKIFVRLFVFVFALRLGAGQNPGGNQLSCEAADPDSNDPVDNLSCASNIPLTIFQRCYARSDLCNGANFCSDGMDEGSSVVALDCTGVFAGTGVPSYICSDGIVFPPSIICDGVANCTQGDDEVTSLCENKCLLPYYGGCPYSRECISDTFARTCEDCLPGFVEPTPSNTDVPCLIEIGLEMTAYTGSEVDQVTGDICVVLFINEAAFAGGIDGVFNTLQFDHDSETISAEISSSVASGTNAAQGGDFSAMSINVTLNKTQTRSCVTFSVTDDSDFDPNEVFDIELTSLSAFAVVRPDNASAVVTINDNEPGETVGFERTMYSFIEGSPGQLEVCIELLNSAGTFSSFTVSISSVDNTATNPMDFTALSNRMLMFQANSPVGTTVCTNIAINDDNDVEGTETFFLDISSSQASIEPGRGRATVEISDTVTCDFEDAITLTVENDVTVMVCMACTPNTLSSPIFITVISSDGTASAGLDYNPVNRRLTFSPGNTRQCANVNILEDLLVEGDETVLFTAMGVSVGQTGTTTLTIIDDDTPSVGIVEPNPPAIPESDDAMVCVEITNSVTLAPGMTVDVTISTRDGSATAPGDYTEVNNVVMTFDSTNSASNLCFNIPINDDNLCEDTETFFVDLTSPAGVPVSPSTAVITIEDNDRAEIALTDPQPDMFMDGVYHVTECSDEGFYFDISITNNIQKGPGVSCVISVTTVDATAEAGSDYEALNGNCVLDNSNSECEFHIGILDDFTAEMTESFYISIVSSDPARCNIANDLITVNITDDEDCDDDVCSEICEELMCPNNFTCIETHFDPYGAGDDPHFAVTLSSGKTLCYTVQGEHGFAFNLISNKKVYMNAMFVPDKDREEVTWLGTMGIVVANSNGFKKSNMTRLRFEAIKNKIHIDDQMVLDARNIEKITIKNGKLTISEAPPMEGYKQPFVRVDLVDVQLSFSIKFMTEHLDLYWHSTGQNVEDSHGIIGQFFDKKIVVDEVRKFLLIPGKEPVPIETRPVWSFMERMDRTNSTNVCWVALNPGYQGEGLIDGSYLNYLVDDVLSTEFMYRKL